jgi:WD40 repeat protein
MDHALKMFLLTCLLLFSAYSAIAGGSVELVLDKESDESPDSNRVHDVEFAGDGSITVIGSQGQRLEVWNIGSGDLTRAFKAALLDVKSARWVGASHKALISSPLQVAIWDTDKVEPISEVQTSSIDGWPIVALPSGLCVWEDFEGNNSFITVQNLLKPEERVRLKLGEDRAIALDISFDGKYLAVAVNHPRIRLWSLENHGELPALPLQRASAGGPVIPMNKMVAMEPGAATTVRFSPDGRLLATGNESAIQIWKVLEKDQPLLLRSPEVGIAGLAFSSNSRHLYSTSFDGTVRQWPTDGAKGDSVVIAEVGKPVTNFWVRSDDLVLATASVGGKVDLWDVPHQRHLGRIHLLANEKGWIVTTPDGVFDSSEEAWRHASWRFRDSEKIEPMEVYFRDFYEPGLLSEVLLGENVPSRKPIEQLSRAVPELKLEILEETTDKVHLRIDVKPGDETGKVMDLCVTQGGIVVHKWPGELLLSNGHASVEISLPINLSGTRITAYAYNQDYVRSQEALWERPRRGWGVPVGLSTLHVIAVGISKYDNQAFNLEFAGADADLVSETFSVSDADLLRMSRRASDWAFDEMIQRHLQSQTLEKIPTTIQITKLEDKDANRERILGALRNVATSAKPGDSFLFVYSGHGLSDNDHFYLVPSDAKLSGGNVTAADIQTAASSLISDDDLEQALQSLFVAHAAIVLDACQSGQVLQGSELQGPLRSQGFPRLAYEKGMYLLTSTQGSELASEPKSLRHGILVYALFQEGLREWKADFRPKDGRIDLREWLSYGALRVDALAREAMLKLDSDKRLLRVATQRARLVPRAIREEETLVLSVADTRPGD